MSREKITQSLSDVKQAIVDVVSKNANTPSVAHMAQVTLDHLDTTYLWAMQTLSMIEFQSEAAVERAAAKAEAEGTMVVAPSGAPDLKFVE